MDKILKIGHWYNSGDFLTLMPGLKHKYETFGVKTRVYQKLNMPVGDPNWSDHSVKNEVGVNTSMNQYMFEMMRPLVESQEYIESWVPWEGQEVDYDSIRSRDSRMIPIPHSDIHFWHFYMFPELTCDLGEAWIKLPPNGNVFNDIVISDHVIVNRTWRYTNPYISYYFLKEYENNLIFSGTEEEHKLFCETFNLEMPRLIVKDFLELAQALKSCRFFLGNQSLNFHIANSIKSKRILEVCASYCNTLPHGKDGWAFLHQPALEIIFRALFNNGQL
jgi:hypothetical protein